MQNQKIPIAVIVTMLIQTVAAIIRVKLRKSVSKIDRVKEKNKV
ncbi:hypothetical protein [Wolbachia endosymbiont (group A) of Anomoia purmunda]|nr:hypothetical protein [Wolbachia endosymbiont (group A) of Anomoia purmunda]